MSLNLEAKHGPIDPETNLSDLFVDGQLRFDPEEQKLPENLAIIRGQAVFISCDQATGIKLFYNKANNLYLMEMPAAFGGFHSNADGQIIKITDIHGHTADYLVGEGLPQIEALTKAYEIGTKKDVLSTGKFVQNRIIAIILTAFLAVFISKNIYDTLRGDPPAIIKAIQQAVSKSGTIKVEPIDNK